MTTEARAKESFLAKPASPKQKELFLMKRIIAILAILTILGGTLVAEGQQEAAGQMEEKGDIDLVYVEWARMTAITHVAGEILTRMGYDVDITSVANAAMWAAIATGDADAHLGAWLPSTHGMFYGEEGEYTDEVVQVAKNYEGAKLGLVVPAYVEEDSIPELVANAEKYDNTIVGIDPGAGMMQQTESAIENDVTGLGVFELTEGSGATMTAALSNAIENEEPIVVTGWRPHWKFGRWDLKILDDPDLIFGESETVYNMARMGLEEEMPEFYRFLEEFDWFQVDLGEVLVWNQEGMDPEDSAEKFVNENTDLINSAMPEGMSL